MNWQLFWVLSTAVLFQATAAAEAPVFGDMAIEEFFSRRCKDRRLGVYDANSFHNVKLANEQLSADLKEGYVMLHVDPIRFCKEHKGKLKKSAERFGRAMDVCFLKEGENYLAEFIPKAVKYVTKFLCDDKGKNIYVMFGEDSRICLNAIANENGTNSQQLKTCMQEKIFRPENNGILTEQELCNDINDAKRCYSQFLSKTCPDNRVAYNLKEGFFKAFKEPCSSLGIRNYLNSFAGVILIMLSVFSNKLFAF